jgi:hypothetical protein
MPADARLALPQDLGQVDVVQLAARERARIRSVASPAARKTTERVARDSFRGRPVLLIVT